MEQRLLIRRTPSKSNSAMEQRLLIRREPLLIWLKLFPFSPFYLFEVVQSIVIHEVDLQTEGEEVVKWMQFELDTLIPHFEMIEALPGRLPEVIENLTGRIREVIRRAEDLTETHDKSVIQRNAGKWNMAGRIRSITKQLHGIKDEIARARDELSVYVQHAFPSLLQSVNSMPAVAEQRLPSYLRRCTHYLILFPADFEVPARRLIVLWVAEGLVRSKKYDDESVEQIANRYLNELIDLQVLVVTNRKRNGEVKTCKLDGRRRSAVLTEALSDNFLQDRNHKIRRLVDCNGSVSGSDSFIQIHGNPAIFESVKNYENVISFLSFNTQDGSTPGEDIGDFLRKCISSGRFIWMRVLDLERVFRPKLPKTLGKLIGLKYLGLRWTYLEQLPAFVSKLFNLQVLDVKHTHISVLPRSIWRMQYLRHLYLSEAYRTRFSHPSSQITLTSLQTLWGAFIDEDTCVINGLDTLRNVRKLGLSCRSSPSKLDHMSKQLKAINRWISKLKSLESLRLKSRDQNGEAVDLHLTSLEGNRKLSTVYLLGKLDGLILCELPVSLTDITLSGSELDLDPIGFLGRLPNLVILRLLGQSVLYKKMYCSRRGFPLLKFLYIWKLKNLEGLEAEEGSLPSLEELEIRSCCRLKRLPDRLRGAQNLKIKLTSMPPEFVQIEGEYAKVEHVPQDDQYILTNTPTRFEQGESSRR